MKSRIASNLKPLLSAFYAFVIAIAVVWVMPRNAHAQLYVTQRLPESNSGFVNEYDADTGTVTKANFITGLDDPLGLAVKGNRLFVVNLSSGTVGEYNATTGEVINANFITGLSSPFGIAVKSAK